MIPFQCTNKSSNWLIPVKSVDLVECKVIQNSTNTRTYLSGDDKIEKLGKCEFEGRTYTEGEKIYPERSSCHTCLCTKDFNSSIPVESNKNCKKADCGIELRNLYRLQSGCVPVYFGSSNCCPIDYRCRNISIFRKTLSFSLIRLWFSFQHLRKMKLCQSKDELI